MERYTRPKAVAGVEYVVYHLDMSVDYVVVVGGSRLREDSGELGLLRQLNASVRDRIIRTMSFPTNRSARKFLLLRESLKRFWSDTQGS